MVAKKEKRYTYGVPRFEYFMSGLFRTVAQTHKYMFNQCFWGGGHQCIHVPTSSLHFLTCSYIFLIYVLDMFQHVLTFSYTCSYMFLLFSYIFLHFPIFPCIFFTFSSIFIFSRSFFRIFYFLSQKIRNKNYAGVDPK